MKTTPSNPLPDDEDDLAVEYAFNYTRAKPNRFTIQNRDLKFKVSKWEYYKNSKHQK
jgi:hypothetical protein